MPQIRADWRKLAEHCNDMKSFTSDLEKKIDISTGLLKNSSSLLNSQISEIEEQSIILRHKMEILDAEYQSLQKEGDGNTKNRKNKLEKIYNEITELKALEEELLNVWNTLGEAASLELKTMTQCYNKISALWKNAESSVNEYIAILQKEENIWETDDDMIKNSRSHSKICSNTTTYTGDNSKRKTSNIGNVVYKTANGARICCITMAGNNRHLGLDKTSVANAYRLAIKYGDNEAASKCRCLFEVETLRKTLELEPKDSGVIQLDGYHKDVKGIEGYDSHHIPQRSVQDENADLLPAIAMLRDDHKKTDSYARKSNHIT